MTLFPLGGHTYDFGQNIAWYSDMFPYKGQVYALGASSNRNTELFITLGRVGIINNSIATYSVSTTYNRLGCAECEYSLWFPGSLSRLPFDGTKGLLYDVVYNNSVLTWVTYDVNSGARREAAVTFPKNLDLNYFTGFRPQFYQGMIYGVASSNAGGGTSYFLATINPQTATVAFTSLGLSISLAAEQHPTSVSADGKMRFALGGGKVMEVKLQQPYSVAVKTITGFSSTFTIINSIFWDNLKSRYFGLTQSYDDTPSNFFFADASGKVTKTVPLDPFFGSLGYLGVYYDDVKRTLWMSAPIKKGFTFQCPYSDGGVSYGCVALGSFPID